jgi:hypothetical protein
MWYVRLAEDARISMFVNNVRTTSLPTRLLAGDVLTIGRSMTDYYVRLEVDMTSEQVVLVRECDVLSAQCFMHHCPGTGLRVCQPLKKSQARAGQEKSGRTPLSRSVAAQHVDPCP